MIPYDMYTYGELKIESIGKGLQLWNYLKLEHQLIKERAKNKQALKISTKTMAIHTCWKILLITRQNLGAEIGLKGSHLNTGLHSDGNDLKDPFIKQNMLSLLKSITRYPHVTSLEKRTLQYRL